MIRQQLVEVHWVEPTLPPRRFLRQLWTTGRRASRRRHELGRDWLFYEAGEMLLFRRKKLSGS